MRASGLLALLVACLVLAGCATTSLPAAAPTDGPQARLHGDAARPSQAEGWLRSELYFAVGQVGDEAPGQAAQRWLAFLDEEVTPRFPDGLSVFDAYGQWQSRDRATPARLLSKQLVILHPDTPEQRARIDAIRLAWKRQTGHQSVLWAAQRVEVSF